MIFLRGGKAQSKTQRIVSDARYLIENINK